MPRIGNYPTTYNERKYISIGDLRKWGYLKPYTRKSGTFSWSRNGVPNGSITIITHMELEHPYVVFTYTWNKEKEISYNVPLVKKGSNLGKGQIYYFECPFIKKLCRKLYLIDGYFCHREAVKGYYDKQIQSKHYRALEKAYGPMFQQEKLYTQLYSKHFRKFYKGKPTKRYLKIMNGISTANNISPVDFINAIASK